MHQLGEENRLAIGVAERRDGIHAARVIVELELLGV